ncbi:MAG: hypothetical protein H0W99_00575 [Acidobacteria bacterium]|nr:hypothetical protein [Acidobacteriota bacterium]
MKKQSLRMVVILSFLMILSVSSAHAQSSREMTAKIPFSFIVANKTFPAGDYSVTRLNPQSDKAALAIKSMDGRLSKVVLTMSVQAGALQERAKLVFTRYNDQYYLSQIWTPADNTGLELPKSRSERTLLARNLAGERAPERMTIPLTARRR